jgi:hypothetical protein
LLTFSPERHSKPTELVTKKQYENYYLRAGFEGAEAFFRKMEIAHLKQIAPPQKVKDTPPPTRCWRIAPANTGPTNVNVALSNSIPLRILVFDLVQKSG